MTSKKAVKKKIPTFYLDVAVPGGNEYQSQERSRLVKVGRGTREYPTETAVQPKNLEAILQKMYGAKMRSVPMTPTPATAKENAVVRRRGPPVVNLPQLPRFLNPNLVSQFKELWNTLSEKDKFTAKKEMKGEDPLVIVDNGIPRARTPDEHREWLAGFAETPNGPSLLVKMAENVMDPEIDEKLRDQITPAIMASFAAGSMIKTHVLAKWGNVVVFGKFPTGEFVPLPIDELFTEQGLELGTRCCDVFVFSSDPWVIRQIIHVGGQKRQGTRVGLTTDEFKEFQDKKFDPKYKQFNVRNRVGETKQAMGFATESFSNRQKTMAFHENKQIADLIKTIHKWVAAFKLNGKSIHEAVAAWDKQMVENRKVQAIQRNLLNSIYEASVKQLGRKDEKSLSSKLRQRDAKRIQEVIATSPNYETAMDTLQKLDDNLVVGNRESWTVDASATPELKQWIEFLNEPDKEKQYTFLDKNYKTLRLPDPKSLKEKKTKRETKRTMPKVEPEEAKYNKEVLDELKRLLAGATTEGQIDEIVKTAGPYAKLFDIESYKSALASKTRSEESEPEEMGDEPEKLV